MNRREFIRASAAIGLLGLPSSSSSSESPLEAVRQLVVKSSPVEMSKAAGQAEITVGGPMPSIDMGEKVEASSIFFRYIGGWDYPRGPAAPRDQLRSAFNLTFESGATTGVGTAVEFRTGARDFEVLAYGDGSSAAFRLVVGGVVLAEYDGGRGDGSMKWLRVGLPAGLSDVVRLEYSGLSAFGGLNLKSDMRPYRPRKPVLAFFGDSFIEGAGTLPTQKHDALAAVAARALGFDDYKMSGFGGTGYKLALPDPSGQNRPGLANRISQDLRPADAIIIGCGLNDAAADPNIEPEVARTLDRIRLLAPGVPVLVLGCWGNGRGGRVRGTDRIDAIIEAEVADRAADGFAFAPIYDVAFSKSDETHPDVAGHAALGEAIAERFRTALLG